MTGGLEGGRELRQANGIASSIASSGLAGMLTHVDGVDGILSTIAGEGVEGIYVTYTTRTRIEVNNGVFSVNTVKQTAFVQVKGGFRGLGCVNTSVNGLGSVTWGLPRLKDGVRFGGAGPSPSQVRPLTERPSSVWTVKELDYSAASTALNREHRSRNVCSIAPVRIISPGACARGRRVRRWTLQRPLSISRSGGDDHGFIPRHRTIL